MADVLSGSLLASLPLPLLLRSTEIVSEAPTSGRALLCYPSGSGWSIAARSTIALIPKPAQLNYR